MPRHVHYDEIVAFAEGKQIQLWIHTEGQWKDVTQPAFSLDCLYRVKPEPKPYFIRYVPVGNSSDFFSVRGCFRTPGTGADIGYETVGELKLTFDGETKKLISAEVI